MTATSRLSGRRRRSPDRRFPSVSRGPPKPPHCEPTSSPSSPRRPNHPRRRARRTTTLRPPPPRSCSGRPAPRSGPAARRIPDQGDATRLFNLAPTLPAEQQYSRISLGHRELIDHVLVSDPAGPQPCVRDGRFPDAPRGLPARVTCSGSQPPQGRLAQQSRRTCSNSWSPANVCSRSIRPDDAVAAVPIARLSRLVCVTSVAYPRRSGASGAQSTSCGPCRGRRRPCPAGDTVVARLDSSRHDVDGVRRSGRDPGVRAGAPRLPRRTGRGAVAPASVAARLAFVDHRAGGRRGRGGGGRRRRVRVHVRSRRVRAR